MNVISRTSAVMAALLLAMTANAGDFTRYVDPFIGTGAVEGGLSGNNYPGATMPFGMIQLSPDTHEAPDWYNASGYDYNDSEIHGFSHTRLSGTGASDLIDLLVFPTTSGATVSSFSHDQESASPGYYRVELADEHITAELTATERTGIHRYTFPAGADDCRLWIDLDHSANKGSWNRRIINSQIRRVGDNVLEGYRVITGWAKLRKVYFHMEFSVPITSLSLVDGDRRYDNTASLINGTALKALVGFGKQAEPVIVKTSLSNVSAANARHNMEVEARHFDFDNYRESADSVWDGLLGMIEVTGDTEKKTTFYTALYHTMTQPNLFSDANGEYTGADYSTKKLDAGERQFTTFSLWDTYRAAHPLYTLLFPDLTRDFVNSMIRHYDDYGYLPIWHLWGQDNYCMIGNHAIPVVVDAVLKGTDGIDAAHAYEAVRNSSTLPHPNSPFDVWDKFGYMPEEIQTQSVSITLEMAYDDWCVAQLARFLGHDADYAYFSSRSTRYRNLYDASAGFFCPKDSNGDWIRPFDPLKYGANGGFPFTEGNAWQYYWYVPHDIEGLISLTGGKDAFKKKLDTFFTLTETSGEKNDNISGMIGQYAHGNEPSHHVAYLYNDAGYPASAQKTIHRIMTGLYNNSSSGYAGNDDCGEMSAWYVFSAMGFYPVDPTSGEYHVGTPTFGKCVIHLPSGKDFTITASRKNPDSHIVKSVRLNGKDVRDYRLRHSSIVDGGELRFVLE